MNHKKRTSPVHAMALALGGLAMTASHASAHMPWLATDEQGHAVLWFGESPADRTYHMPEAISTIKLSSQPAGEFLATDSVDDDDLVGLRTNDNVDLDSEIAGTVTYGLYHGTKLTYHVEHLPQPDPSGWPTEPRGEAAYQTVITPSPAGGVSVAVLAAGKPITDVEVKLYFEDGHEEASAKTDVAGMVTFPKAAVEPGLNAILINLSRDDAKGEYDGSSYTSTTDVLTATFNQPGKNAGSAKPAKQSVKVDPQSGASVGASGLPDLPEELTSFGAAIAEGKLYVYGGHTGNAHSYSIDEQSNRMWCLDLGETAWQQVSTGPSLQGLALVPYQDRVVRIGGFTASNAVEEEHVLDSQTSVAAFDPSTKEWSELAPLPEPRSSLDAAVLGDHVYVFGGWNMTGDSDSSQWHQTAWSLDLSQPGSEWKAIATPPMKRRAISVAAHRGKLFVIGGMQSEGGPTTKVDLYDPSTDAWTEGPAIPGTGMSGFGSAAFATDGHLIVTTMDGFAAPALRGRQSLEHDCKDRAGAFLPSHVARR